VTVLASGLPLPWGLAALAFGAAALAAGVVALVAAVRARVRAVAVVVLSVGLALVVLVFVGGLLQVAVYPLAVEYQECVAEAITAEAAPRCQQDLRRGLLDLAFGR
jgi:membrane protein implicated in regulation of membrane protease activity